MSELPTPHQEAEPSSLSVLPVFDHARYSALLSVEGKKLEMERMSEFAQVLDVRPKEEFHVTILGSDRGRMVEKTLALSKHQAFQQKNTLEQLFLHQPWKVIAKPEWYFVQKTYPNEGEAVEYRKSIIQRVEVPQLSDFYQKLNLLLGTSFPLPFPHVTLFTASTNPEKMLRGIGIDSFEEFKKLEPVRLQ